MESGVRRVGAVVAFLTVNSVLEGLSVLGYEAVVGAAGAASFTMFTVVCCS